MVEIRMQSLILKFYSYLIAFVGYLYKKFAYQKIKKSKKMRKTSLKLINMNNKMQYVRFSNMIAVFETVFIIKLVTKETTKIMILCMFENL